MTFEERLLRYRQMGYRVVSGSYLVWAVGEMRRRLADRPVHFVVAGTDEEWNRAHLPNTRSAR